MGFLSGDITRIACAYSTQSLCVYLHVYVYTVHKCKHSNKEKNIVLMKVLENAF